MYQSLIFRFRDETGNCLIPIITVEYKPRKTRNPNCHVYLCPSGVVGGILTKMTKAKRNQIQNPLCSEHPHTENEVSNLTCSKSNLAFRFLYLINQIRT